MRTHRDRRGGLFRAFGANRDRTARATLRARGRDRGDLTRGGGGEHRRRRTLTHARVDPIDRSDPIRSVARSRDFKSSSRYVRTRVQYGRTTRIVRSDTTKTACFEDDTESRADHRWAFDGDTMGCTHSGSTRRKSHRVHGDARAEIRPSTDAHTASGFPSGEGARVNRDRHSSFVRSSDGACVVLDLRRRTDDATSARDGGRTTTTRRRTSDDGHLWMSVRERRGGRTGEVCGGCRARDRAGSTSEVRVGTAISQSSLRRRRGDRLRRSGVVECFRAREREGCKRALETRRSSCALRRGSERGCV